MCGTHTEEANRVKLYRVEKALRTVLRETREAGVDTDVVMEVEKGAQKIHAALGGENPEDIYPTTGDEHSPFHPASEWEAESKPLKFAPGPLQVAKTADTVGRNAATIRHDGEKDISTGDVIEIVSAETNEVCGKGIVKHVEETDVRRALDEVAMWWAEYGCQTRDELLDTLNQHYDGVITAESDVKVIIFDPVFYEVEDK